MHGEISNALSLTAGPEEAQLRRVMREVIDEAVAPQLAELRRFVDRRLAEVSVEIHGTTQLMGFTEDALTQQLGRMHEQIAHMISAPSAATRNSGIELESVVQTTEAAANQIMEAAESIGDWVRAAALDKATIGGLTEKIDAIFEACAFQDLTSQRVRRTIENLQQLETTLSALMPPVQDSAPASATPPDLAQTEIDQLLS